jgi:hypothetical protein
MIISPRMYEIGKQRIPPSTAIPNIFQSLVAAKFEISRIPAEIAVR